MQEMREDELRNRCQALHEALCHARRIMVLTGAGMSTESGIPDFRSQDGLWQDEDLVSKLSDDYLRTCPAEFWATYREVFLADKYLKAQPNSGHIALADLEQTGREVLIFTQNVDGLHQRAGSQQVFELHGTNQTATCPACRSRYGLSKMLKEPVPRCDWETMKGGTCGTVLAPDTVLFGQAVQCFGEAIHEARHADLLLVLGTSLTVEPVASIPVIAHGEGVPVAIVNLTPTAFDAMAEVVVHTSIGDALKFAVSELVG